MVLKSKVEGKLSDLKESLAALQKKAKELRGILAQTEDQIVLHSGAIQGLLSLLEGEDAAQDGSE